jgi:hypothetical protein
MYPNGRPLKEEEIKRKNAAGITVFSNINQF